MDRGVNQGLTSHVHNSGQSAFLPAARTSAVIARPSSTCIRSGMSFILASLFSDDVTGPEGFRSRGWEVQREPAGRERGGMCPTANAGDPQRLLSRDYVPAPRLPRPETSYMLDHSRSLPPLREETERRFEDAAWVDGRRKSSNSFIEECHVQIPCQRGTCRKSSVTLTVVK